MTENSPACTVTVACNNICEHLIEAKDSRYIEYPRRLMVELVGEHSLAYHILLGDTAVLFDTGGMQKTLMHNLPAIDTHAGTTAAQIATIVLSHGHHDHVGSVVPFLAVRREKEEGPIDFACHPDAFAPRYRAEHMDTLDLPRPADGVAGLIESGELRKEKGIVASTVEKLGATIMQTKDPLLVFEDSGLDIKITTTGEIPRLVERGVGPTDLVIEHGDRIEQDWFADDQALIIEKKGAFAAVLLGCGHAGIENTIAQAKTITQLPIRLVAGGFHMVGAPPEVISRKVEFLETLAAEGTGCDGPEKLILRPCHCAGEAFYLSLKSRASDLLDVERLPVGTRIRI
jgi:7,8-dihydropterin-6-yl-methyl-4-(beta-D-ribofuranosyl)aminobenzene 5'-phosphate synthase